MNTTTKALMMTALLTLLGLSTQVQAAPNASTETLHEWTAPAAACDDFCDNCYIAALLTCFVLSSGSIKTYTCGPDPKIANQCNCAFTCLVTAVDRFVAPRPTA